MASNETWSDRKAADKKRLYLRYTIVYAVGCVIAIALSWGPIALILGLIAVVLAGLWFWTPDDPPERPKPDWMLAMEDENTPTSAEDPASPRFRDLGPTDPQRSAPNSGTNLPDVDTDVTGRPEDPPSPTD